MPLLTHAETGAESVARHGAVALEERVTQVDGGSTGAGARRPRSRWRRVRHGLYWLLAVVVLVPVLAFVIGWMLFDVPTPETAAVKQVATFTFADGTPLATVRPDNVNRVNVTLDKVPEQVQHAVLAAEDRSFFSNPGFDVIGIGRAVWKQLTGGSGGGSTITQQYVKVSTGQDQVSLWRKYKEVVLAVKISHEQTKQEILENYLNLIYLGRGAYGIQAASQAYFGKDVDRLTVSEGAMLAGIIRSPSRWDPAKNPARSVERWSFVLDGMVEQGWLTPAARAQQRFPTSWLPEAPSLGGIPGDDRGHIYNRARDELEARGITEEQISTDGLTITTTIDPQHQKQAVAAVDQVMKGQPANLRTALVSVDPRTGAIIAYYGGSDGVGTDYAQALRQPGSSFKPFVLSAALQGPRSVGLGTTYDGSSPQKFPGNVEVANSEGFNCGQCTVQTAMTQSINTIFYRMAIEVGPAKVVDAAHQAGIPADLLPQAQGGIALGDQEVHPQDMAAAFATLAADGVRHEPFIVSKVTAADGRVLFDRADTPGEQAVPQQVARNVTESMLDVASFSKIALADGRPVASKTGTVQHPTIDKQNKDAWMVGYTPSISTAVWVGTDTSDPIKNSAGRPVYGRMLPGSMWQAYMDDALRGTPEEQFSPFVPMGTPPVVESAGSGDTSSTTGSNSTDSSGTVGFRAPDTVPPSFDPSPGGDSAVPTGRGGGFGAPSTSDGSGDPYGQRFSPGDIVGLGRLPGEAGRAGPAGARRAVPSGSAPP